MKRMVWTVCAVLCVALTAGPGFGEDKTDKEAERAAKEQAREVKNLRSYEKIKIYSTDKYASDPDFRDEVDQGYAETLREHKEVAFEKNTNRRSRVYAINEDRFRMNDEKELYDNLMVQSRINRVGQSLVPKDSDRLFAFRLTADPTPSAETLATGTIYISTGMVSLLDNEAQLAYVLAHEMAHVQLDHWKQKVMLEKGVTAYNGDQSKKAERIGMIAGLAGGLASGITSKSVGTGFFSGLAIAGTGYVVSSLLDKQVVVNWDKAQEDEADQLGFKALLNAHYDVREVPKLYALVETVVSKDTRVGLGFLGERSRIRERKESAERLIANAYKADIEAQLKGGGFKGDSADHRNLMAELKRDNGIMAYYNDMFSVARQNLEEATSIRDNDPTAQYYYGKVLEIIGRTPEDRKLAEQCFVKAALNDQKQQENFGAHLHRALMMMEDNTQNSAQLTTELDTYVTDYVRYQIEFGKSSLLPPNINTISEYMRRYGKTEWTPSIPSGAEDLRIGEYQLPRTPGEAKAKAVPVSTAVPTSNANCNLLAKTANTPGPAGLRAVAQLAASNCPAISQAVQQRNSNK